MAKSVDFEEDPDLKYGKELDLRVYPDIVAYCEKLVRAAEDRRIC